MKYTLFESVKAQRGELCTYEKFIEVSHSPIVAEICAAIAQEPDHDRQGVLKKRLPAITFNAHFEGQRKNELAEPSGAFMVDLDGVENPFQFYTDHICGRKEELDIVYVGLTPSRHGLRIVAKCRPEFATIAECQQWFGDQIGWPCDPACKDWARASYVVPDTYHYYLDAKAMFMEEPTVKYEVKVNAPSVKVTEKAEPKPTSEEPETQPSTQMTSTRQSFKGIPLSKIAMEWLRMTGGEPVEGERNSRLFDCARALRHITDFNEAVLLEALPTYGLPNSEMRTLIHSACTTTRGSRPKELDELLSRLTETTDAKEDDLSLSSSLSTLHPNLPPLPPLIRQIVQTAPEDFRKAAILCQLPILGTLGSKLRARYLDKVVHSPSFLVSLEAPQASGKNFMTRLAEMELAPLMTRDREAFQAEKEYSEKAKTMGSKYTPEQREDLLGPRPKGIIRCIPPTASITKLLMRMDNARGLHLFAMSEEIDTVTKAFKRGFSNYSDLLRVAFGNGKFGQDYASDTSYSGTVEVYYNALFSGTPKQMRDFYPDVENGLVSRVLFVTLPDQFGKPMPVWGDLTEKARKEVEKQIARLDAVSVVGDVVQPDHMLNIDFLLPVIEQWIKEQQQEAVRTGDRTRDTFCRRSAVVGFRAGMLAWFLYGEKNTRTFRKNTAEFARWVADQMLTQHLLRFQIDGSGSNTNRWEGAFNLLPDEFSRDDVQRVLNATGSNTPLKNVLYKWHLLGCIEDLEKAPASNGKQQAVRFRKK